MNKDKKRKNKKIKHLIAFCSLSSFIFIVATYAWFIGMRQVNVSSFEIEIASTDSLLLSLDGSKWDTTVTINKENFKTVSYTNNVNNWAGVGTTESNTGLKPISSIGEMDPTTSTMKMFEKGSLTATPGGYRLLASRIHNYDTPIGGFTEGENPQPIGQYKEIGGYIAFDLFVRNFSGQAYYDTNQPLNEEAIYLTTDSEVKVRTTGANAQGVAGTGIENSVRVGFAQIGRVNGKTTDVATITGISCSDTTTGSGANAQKVVTGICRTAQIWEPNDTDHVDAAISYYDTSCRVRPVAEGQGANPTDITLASSYVTDATEGKCETVEDGTANATYAIRRVISVADKVDVYDGEEYNGYTANVKTGEGDEPLFEYDYFTDTEKDLTSMNRPTFMTLAPNSITKIRVYVWIEGQDIDNYDFASIGKQINVAFGFTKERFTETEAQGNDGPYMPKGDSTKPTFSGVASTKSLTAAQVASYDPMNGVSATDVNSDVTQNACTTAGGTWSGTPKCLYTKGDNAGSYGDEATQEACEANTTDGGSWVGICTYDLTTKIQVTNPVQAAAGEYVVRYLVSDWQGNYAEATSTVTVTAGN